MLVSVLVAHSVPAWAVLIDSGNGNTSAPADDPGWRNVGFLDSLNAVYVGYGWVMTASHVGISSVSEVILDGVSYSVQTSSRVVIEHDATHEADLHVFRISPEPGSGTSFSTSFSTSTGSPCLLTCHARITYSFCKCLNKLDSGLRRNDRK